MYGVPKTRTCVLLNFSGSDIRPPNPKFASFQALSEELLLKSEFIYDFRKGYRYCGLPQGSGISPILSIMCLIMLNELANLPTPIYAHKYADDGIFYSNHDVNPLEVLAKQKFGFDTGCIFSIAKSGWVKQHGIWLKPLKMLGIVYNGITDELTAQTRGKPQGLNAVISASRLKLQIQQIISVPAYDPPLDPQSFGGHKRLSSIYVCEQKESDDAIVFPIITRSCIIENRQEYESFKLQFNNWIQDQEIDSEVIRAIYPSYLRITDEICEKIGYDLPGFVYERLFTYILNRRLAQLYQGNDCWFLQKPWLVKQFNETLIGKHYLINDDRVHNLWGGELVMSLHIHPLLFAGGKVETLASLDQVVASDNWKKPIIVDSNTIEFQEVANSKIYDFVRSQFIMIVPLFFFSIMDFYADLCLSVILIFLIIFFLQIGKNQPEVDSERVYKVVSMDYKNTWRDKKLFNFLMSGMYRGSFNPQDVEQDFSLRLDEDSLVGRTFDRRWQVRWTGVNTFNLSAITGPGNDINAFNMSSIGCALLNKYLKTNSLNEDRKKVNDADIWIKTYGPLFNRLRWRRPGPSLIKPWAGLLRQKDEMKEKNAAKRLELDNKIASMKKNYIPEFTKPYLIDPKNIDSQTGEFLTKTWKDDGYRSKRINSGSPLWNRSTLMKLMRYEIAEQNKDKSKRQVFKLILVSLFGRMGQKEIEDRCVIVSKEEAEKIVKIKHYSKAIPMSDDKTLIIHQGYVDQELLNMIEENSDPVNPLERTRGVISSIPVAAAITAYGRMSITKFLLMDNLKVHYIVTDGITIDQKLPDEMVSSDLGAMKHEYEVKEGIIITVNTLWIKTNEGKEITKCAGFNAKSGYVVKNNNENDKSNKLSYKEYQSLYEGEDVKLSHEIWRSSLENGTVQITRQEFNIKGLRNKS
jgi:hypothetical protein